MILTTMDKSELPKVITIFIDIIAIIIFIIIIIIIIIVLLTKCSDIIGC